MAEIKISEDQELSEILKIRREKLKALQEAGNYTELLVLQEEAKTLPFGDIWHEYLKRQNVPDENWFDIVKDYETKVLALRK